MTRRYLGITQKKKCKYLISLQIMIFLNHPTQVYDIFKMNNFSKKLQSLISCDVSYGTQLLKSSSKQFLLKLSSLYSRIESKKMEEDQMIHMEESEPFDSINQRYSILHIYFGLRLIRMLAHFTSFYSTLILLRFKTTVWDLSNDLIIYDSHIIMNYNFILSFKRKIDVCFAKHLAIPLEVNGNY
jgi:hypothetical protein